MKNCRGSVPSNETAAVLFLIVCFGETPLEDAGENTDQNDQAQTDHHGGHFPQMMPQETAGHGTHQRGAGVDMLDEDVGRVSCHDVTQQSSARSCDDAHEDQQEQGGLRHMSIEILQTKNKSLQNPDLSDCVEELTDVILGAMEITYNSCLSVLLNPESMNLILSKLPPDVLDKHRVSDGDICDGFFKAIADEKGINVEALTGSFMMIIFGGMYKTVIGTENWKESMRIVLRGIVMQLV